MSLKKVLGLYALLLLEVVSVLRFNYWKLDAGVWERISADG